MAGQFFELRHVADFAPGFLENTVVEDDCIQLSHRGGTYAQSGIYTSVPFQPGPFFSLMPSWNADTSPGTSVEMQVRLAAEGQWSQWFSFGVWSPYIERSSPPPAEDKMARAAADTLSVQDGLSAASTAQLRVLLATEDTSLSPKVQYLALSTNATARLPQKQTSFERELELPAYSCLNRDPSIAGRAASVTTLTMLMNRWGRDLLPEEVARMAYDATAGRYNNLAFLCAVAGVHGFRSAAAFASMDRLRQEIWQGRALGARLRYRAPALSGEEAPEAGESTGTELPVLEGATHSSSGHMVAVLGFVNRDGKEMVIVNDPMAPADDGVRREIPLSRFTEMYTGIALFLEKGPKGAGGSAPQRRHASLRLEEGALCLDDADGSELAPARITRGVLSPATLCYTLSDGVAYASAAQRKFYYPRPDEHGRIRFEREAAAGKKITVYLVGPRGTTWVAEKQNL